MYSLTSALTLPRILSLLLFFSLSATALQAQTSGSPDLAFGSNGVVSTPVWQGYLQLLRDVVIQPDGKVLAIGSIAVNNGSASQPRFMLRRYNPDGRVDESFANEGITADWLGMDSKANSAAVLSGGGIVVAGEYGGNLALARYSSNGVRRQIFGGAKGLRVIDLAEPGQTSEDLPKRIVARSNGGFFVVSVRNSYPTGTNPYYSQSSIVVTAHNSYGILDLTYASGGKFVKELPYHNYEIFEVKVQPDGTMFVHANGSNRNDWTDPHYQPPSENIVLKLSPNGLPDNAFGNNGALNSTTSMVNRVLRVLSNGKLIASSGNRAVRMDHAGNIEQEIVNAAQITVDGQVFMKRSYLSQPDGKIIAQGLLPNAPSSWQLAFVRFLPSGEVDMTFGINGLARATGASFMGEHNFFLQDDGKILHAAIGPNFQIILSRYRGDQ